MSSFRTSARIDQLTRLAVAGSIMLTSLAFTGCANTPMAPAEMARTQAPTQAASSCNTNDNYAMSGTIHAATKRDLDECRLLAQRPSRVIVSQSQATP